MPVNHKYKLALCHIPRTAGRSLQITLDLELEKGDHHCPVSWYRTMYKNYTVFAVYRSFEDRKISGGNHWKYSKDFKKPNEWFLDQEPDYLLRFDNLEKEMNDMLVELGIPIRKLKRYNDG